MTDMPDFSGLFSMLADPRNLIIAALCAMKISLVEWDMFPDKHTTAAVTIVGLAAGPCAHEPIWVGLAWGWIYTALAIHVYSLVFKPWLVARKAKKQPAPEDGPP